MAYRYPLENKEQYSGRITFTPVAEEYIDLANSGQSVIAFGRNQVSQFNSTNISSAGEGGGRRLGRRAPRPIRRIINDNLSGPVTLYLPEAIPISDQANYDRFDMGPIGAVAAGYLNKGAGITESLYKSITEGASSVGDLLKGKSGLSTELANLAAVRLAPEALGGEKFARSQLGVTVNPNWKSFFRDVELRTFSFSFKLIASSSAEAEQIQKIIKVFRTELYPETISGPGELNVPIGYKFPNRFKITMQYNGKILPIKFLDSHLMSVQTVYNPSSMGWHADGHPSDVALTLNFGEPEALSKQRIKEGY